MSGQSVRRRTGAGRSAPARLAARRGWWASQWPRRAAAIVIVLLALGVRVWEVQRTSPYRPINDGRSYLTLASQVAHHGDYFNDHAPRSGAGGSIGPTAYFPPAYPYFLAAVDLIDGHTNGGGQAVHDARLATAALGAVAVAALGLVAFEAFGWTTALVAMLIAAVYPPLVAFSGTPYSENLLIPLELAAVWAGLRSERAANPWPWLAASGVLAGLAALTHQNGAVILLPLIFCAVGSARRWVGARKVSARRRTLTAPAGPLVLLACAAVTIAPWTIRNAVVLHSFVPVSDEMGITLAGTYNASSANDAHIPYRWKYYGKLPVFASLARESVHLTEPELSSRLTSAALRYVGHHPAAPAQAAYHNLRRLLELEGSYAWRVSGASIGLSGGTTRICVYAFWVVAALAAAGAFTRRARRAPPWLWAIPILLTLTVILVNAETPRFRAPIDPYLIMLAACAVVTIAQALFRRFGRTAPEPAPAGP